MDNKIIPKLNPAIKIYPFDTEHILVECNNHQLKVKKEFELLINLVNGINNLENITAQYCVTANMKVSESIIYNLFFVDLASYGIIISDKPVKIKERSLHLRLSFIFWKGKSLDRISSYVSFLFNPLFFYTSLILMLLFTIISIMSFNSSDFNKHMVITNVAAYASISFVILMLHELGHVAACHKYGAKHNGIGFGFYLFTPVFFADVSDAWKLPTKERTIINLAGIYFEFVIITILYSCFIITKNEILFYSGIAILFHIGLNLNPFLKYDGYWIVSDLSNTPNLRNQSTIRLKSAFSFVNLKEFSIKDIALLVYAIASYFLIGVFLFILFFYDSQSIIYFPVKISKFIMNYESTLILSFSELFNKLTQNIIPLIFYIVLIRFSYNFFTKYLNAKNKVYAK